MGDILVYVEARNDGVQPAALELLAAARTLAAVTGGSVDALVASTFLDAALGQLGAADRVISVSHPSLVAYVPEAQLAILKDVVADRKPAAVLFSYSTAGIDLAPALAVGTGMPLLAYCTKVTIADGVVTAESQMYGGKVRAVARASLPAVLTIMPGAFSETAAATAATPEVVVRSVPIGLDQVRSEFVKEQRPEPGGFDLSLAERIVCVGRGIGDSDRVAVARELADALGAEIAGSRPVIDQGWLAKERQVGKSGSRVKPKLYLALGVSGAPEHLEGMRASDLIIAVNSDASAPIFSVAHYGVVCDLFELAPALIERLKAGTS